MIYNIFVRTFYEALVAETLHSINWKTMKNKHEQLQQERPELKAQINSFCSRTINIQTSYCSTTIVLLFLSHVT